MRMAVRQQKWAQLSAIPDDQLTTFIFSKNVVDPRLKIIDNREILVDGKLYDVVRKTDDSKQIKFFCVYDHEEEALIAKARLFNSKTQQMPLQNTTRLIAEKIIKTCILKDESSIASESMEIVYSNWPEACYSGPAIQISPPPPQHFC